jgi:hypothetical protein
MAISIQGRKTSPYPLKQHIVLIALNSSSVSGMTMPIQQQSANKPGYLLSRVAWVRCHRCVGNSASKACVYWAPQQGQRGGSAMQGVDFVGLNATSVPQVHRCEVARCRGPWVPVLSL